MAWTASHGTRDTAGVPAAPSPSPALPSPIRFPIGTPRLLIRPLRLDDAEDLVAAYGGADATQHLTADVPTSVEEARDWIRSKIALFEADRGLSLWAVVLRETGAVIGDVGLQHEDYGWGPELGLSGRGNRACWQHGLATEAALACLTAGFAALPIEVIFAETSPANTAAARLLRGVGMQPCGVNQRGWPVFAVTRNQHAVGSARGRQLATAAT